MERFLFLAFDGIISFMIIDERGKTWQKYMWTDIVTRDVAFLCVCVILCFDCFLWWAKLEFNRFKKVLDIVDQSKCDNIAPYKSKFKV